MQSEGSLSADLTGQDNRSLQVLRKEEKGHVALIPFRAGHLREIKPDASDYWMELAGVYEDGGPAYTAMYLGHAIGAAGVYIPRPGIGEAWAMLTPMLKSMPFFLHRKVKRALETLTLRRIHAQVDPRDKKAMDWILTLGFSYEGTFRKFGENEEDIRIYARVK